MIRRYPLLFAFLLLLAALAALAWSNRAHLAAFPGILPAYSAKEFCSCRYVTGNPADYCAGYVEQYLPLGELVDNELHKRVTASALGQTRTAVWRDTRRGCVLMPDEHALPY
ncbi:MULTISPECIES: amidase [unclassified Pseudomonas]|uniref:amidase n=1 Tax=unclassified Pseudomonas TaxID=196821 RepID=UPI00244CD149|nr:MULTISPECIES: amidase [unclassified Pseudomonas]MDH0895789.1 amidase [Pseudomonas sp. GD03875]MDH1064915.1 amidase [Pseudomonas sp. GD03985]